MSLFHHASAWALRALALWGAIELGSALYEQGAAASRDAIQISGHHTAMSRLEERARTQELEAAAYEARQTATSPALFAATSVENASAMIRDHLLQLGAQAPTVDVTSGPGSNAGPHALLLNVSWRERRETAPQAFYALAQRFPQLGVKTLRLETQGDLVHGSTDVVVSLPNGVGAPR